MIYKTFKDKSLSSLGMGAMRFPVIDGEYSKIDVEQTEQMVAYAMEHGINYFDTAWGYHDGQSEVVLGNILSKYPRKAFYLADKFPGYDLANMDKVESIFEEQLKRCKVEYFDFYMFHNVCEMNIDAYLDEKYGIFNYLIEQRRKGCIRHLGFSVHGSYEVTQRFLKAYGEHMEFCQVQLNYLDWNFQKAKEKVELLKEYNIPVWVMEPLRGGKLASLSDENTAKLKAIRPNESVPAWAFRFIQSIPSAIVTLSGMSNFEQLKENIETFKTDLPLNQHELSGLMEIADNMLQKGTLPCTECRYCTSHCPQKLDIPYLISLYNEHSFTEGGFIAPMVLGTLPPEKQPKACIGCKRCEAVCPQQIKIASAMKDFAQKVV